MAADGPIVTDPSVWTGIRAGTRALFDDFGRFIAVNAAVVAIGVLVALLAALHVAGTLAAVLMIPALAALGRMAASTARDRVARLPQAREGIWHRWPTTFVLGVVQLVLLVVGWFNLQLGLAAASLPLIAGGVASGWVVLLVAAAAVASWPLLLDPERDDVGVKPVLRLAGAVAVARPMRTLFLVLLLAVVTLVSVQTIVGAFVLPSFGVLVAAHTVIPVADRLEGRTPTDHDPEA
jgi:hypothetical protein